MYQGNLNAYERPLFENYTIQGSTTHLLYTRWRKYSKSLLGASESKLRSKSITDHFDNFYLVIMSIKYYTQPRIYNLSSYLTIK